MSSRHLSSDDGGVLGRVIDLQPGGSCDGAVVGIMIVGETVKEVRGNDDFGSCGYLGWGSGDLSGSGPQDQVLVTCHGGMVFTPTELAGVFSSGHQGLAAFGVKTDGPVILDCGSGAHNNE